MNELPDEFKKFGKLCHAEEMVYGVMKATSGWEDDYARRRVDARFQRGRAASTMFFPPQTHVRVVVHGDDFTVAATESELRTCAIEDLRKVRRQGARHSRQWTT